MLSTRSAAIVAVNRRTAQDLNQIKLFCEFICHEINLVVSKSRSRSESRTHSESCPRCQI